MKGKGCSFKWSSYTL